MRLFSFLRLSKGNLYHRGRTNKDGIHQPKKGGPYNKSDTAIPHKHIHPEGSKKE